MTSHLPNHGSRLQTCDRDYARPVRDTTLPLLAIVTGRPGSGKTTIARELADALRCPLVSRDRLKEGALHTIGLDHAADPDLARSIFEAFFGQIEWLLRRNISVVAEAAFQQKVWDPNLTSFRELADVRIIVCDVSIEVARQRRHERVLSDPLWPLFHPVPPGWDDATYDPPLLDVPTLRIETTFKDEKLVGTLVNFLADD